MKTAIHGSIYITMDLMWSGGSTDHISELYPPSLQIAIPQTECHSLRTGLAWIQDGGGDCVENARNLELRIWSGGKQCGLSE